MTPRNLLLGLVAPGRTAAAARFEQETLRRGGRFEVMGRSWARSRKTEGGGQESPRSEPQELPADVLAAIGWRKKGMGS